MQHKEKKPHHFSRCHLKVKVSIHQTLKTHFENADISISYRFVIINADTSCCPSVFCMPITSPLFDKRHCAVCSPSSGWSSLQCSMCPHLQHPIKSLGYSLPNRKLPKIVFIHLSYEISFPHSMSIAFPLINSMKTYFKILKHFEGILL